MSNAKAFEDAARILAARINCRNKKALVFIETKTGAIEVKLETPGDGWNQLLSFNGTSVYRKDIAPRASWSKGVPIAKFVALAKGGAA